jgi:C-terminal processing protease CtpA/Prc
VLQALKIVPSLQRAKWTFEDDKGEQFSLELEPVPQDAKTDWLSTLKEVPLYRQRLNEQMWFTTIPDSQAVYLNLKVYPDAETFKRVSDGLWKQVDSSQPKRLIIDLRQSNGGDFIKFQSHLLKELKQRPAFRKPGSLYVIIGRGTISAAMVNAIELRKELNATLVGEPTGSKPNSYSENDELTLPNSHLRVSYSTRYYKLQEQDTSSVMPDKLIESLWEIYTSGRDPALEWILSQPWSAG